MIGLGYITYNEEKYIARSIESVMSLSPDEFFIVDHFSTDNTVDICKSLGAKVVQVEWTHDFSASRNYLNSLFTTPWIFQLDADEHLEGENVESLRDAIEMSESGDIVAYSLIRKNHYPNHDTASPHFGPPFYPDPQVRLFKNQENIFWSGAVHEGVMPSINEGMVGGIGSLSLCIHHHMFRGDQRKFEDQKRTYYRNIEEGVFNEDSSSTN